MAAPVKESDYRLSAELTGHSGDVRGVAGLQTDETKATYIVTTSRDRTARVWLREDQREYKTVKVFRQHKGFVSCACVVPSDSEAGRDKCCIATGSQDNTIMLVSLDGDSEDADHCLTGHKGHVSCITYQCNCIISGSWDGTVKVWDLSSFTLTSSMAAHQPAVWAVSGLYEHDGTHRALSGGADRIIRLWELDTSLCVQEYSGHADVVRDVKVVNADVFLSASNDCVIRKWSIHSAQCLREFYGHQAFVYCLAPTPGLEDDFASCGEDGTIRVWKGGACVQVIKLPCISVWCVCRMDGGDLVAGSSDGIARVFTTEPTRMALPEEIAAFQSKVDEYRSAASGGEQSIDVSSLPGMDALSQPGKKTGDTKLINNKGKAEVYQWDEDTVQWVKIGDAIGQAPKGGSVYKGQEYDYVFDIELDEGNPTMRKLKLPYNKTVDPHIAADEFLTANDLPAGYLDEVAEFIIKNADVDTAFSGGGGIGDPFTGGGRYVPGQGSAARRSQQGEDPFTGSGRYVPGAPRDTQQGEDPFTGRGRYVPGAPRDTQPTVSFTRGSRGGGTTIQPTPNAYFPLESVKTFTSPADYGTKVIAKIREFNSSLLMLNDDQLQLLEAFSTSFSSRSTDALDLLFSLLSTWPQENVFPVLDLVRLAVLNKQCCDYLTTSDIGRDLFQLLIKLASGEAKNHLLVFRILSNVFSYDSGVQLMHSQRVQFFSALTGFMGIENRTNQIALATVILNYSHYYSQHIDQDGISDCVTAVTKVLESQSQDNEAKFRVLVALGTMCQRCMVAVKSASTSIDYSSLLVPLCDVPDPLKISECALHLLELLL